MICRSCGHQIPDWYLHLESFKCPGCGRIYRRRPAQAANASRAPERARIPAGGARQTQYRGGSARNAPPRRSSGPYRKRPSSFRRLMKRRLWKFPVWAWACVILVLGIAGIHGSSPEPRDVTAQQIAAAAPTVEAAQNAPSLSLPTEAPTQIPTQAPTQIPTVAPTRIITAPPTAAPKKAAVKTPAKQVPYEDQACWVTRTGECYHYQDCRTIKGKETRKVTIREAKAHGLRSCKVCDR